MVKRVTDGTARRSLLALALLAPLSMGVFAQVESTLTFMGIQVSRANREMVSKALKANGGKLKGSRESDGERFDVYGFSGAELPGGIKAFTFVFDARSMLLRIEAKLVPGKFWESNTDQKSVEMLDLLKSKYGSPSKIKTKKNVIVSMNEYLWYFGDGGAISLEDKGKLSGSVLTYFNSQAEQRSRIEKKRNMENQF